MSPAKAGLGDRLSNAARLLVAGAGSAVSAVIAAGLVLAWLVVGVTAGFTRGWFEMLFAVTGAVTFIMVFFIQHTTGVENRAVLLKLDELIRVTAGAHNDLIAAEHQSLAEQDRLRDQVTELSGDRS